MRITTNTIMGNYIQNLNTILMAQTAAGERAMTHRKFNSGSEDPSATQQTSFLHRKFLQNKDYMNTIKGEQERLDMALSALDDIQKQGNNVLNDAALKAINGTTSKADRETYAKTFKQIQESMIQFANTQYNNTYLFGGQNNGSIPFEGSGSNITYQGIHVSNGDPADPDALENLSNETVYIDIGLGIQPGMVNNSNAYDSSIPGIELLGYGKTDNGISKNIIALTGEMSELLNCSDEEWQKNGCKRFEEMMGQYKESHDDIIDAQASLGVKSNYLETTFNRMEELDTSYNTQIVDVEYVNDAEAISDYYYTQYTYNAALRLGNTLLGASLLDFIR